MPNKLLLSLSFACYNSLLAVAVGLLLPALLPLTLTSAKRRHTVLQRLGLCGFPCGSSFKSKDRAANRQALRPIWIHALSVGEVLSAIPLVTAVAKCYPRRPILFSVSTHTGFHIAQDHVAEHVSALFYFPYDWPPVVRRAIGRIDPALVVLVETDLWPNFLTTLHKQGIPVALVNARLSAKSFTGYRRFGGFVRQWLPVLNLVAAQTAGDGAKFGRLGFTPDRIHITGNLKFDHRPQFWPPQRLANVRKTLGLPAGCRVLMAGSIHRGEEPVLIEAFRQLKLAGQRLKLIVVPRQPAEGRAIRRGLALPGIRTAIVTDLDNAPRRPDWDVLVVATMGVLQKLYALADVALVGGSIAPYGGHNPLEPAAHAKPVLFGSDMSDFDEIARLLTSSGGARRFSDKSDLSHTVARLLDDTDLCQQMGRRALAVFDAHQGALARTMDLLHRLLPDFETAENR